MDIVSVLLPASVFLALIFVGWYVWALSAGQFEDLETPARRMLFDESDTDDELIEKSQTPHGNR